MKTFLVGGAVRDHLLGLPVTERDWVVVGSEPTALLAQGYQQVGRDFPVFLHPVTHEEYALARTEKKQGFGYHGFDCDAGPKVTLEEDLARRDLTINAIAMDDQGCLIDPYQGQCDIQNKCLRHVSDAFIEDPVRVLRVARFKARFHRLGFEIAPETTRLMQRMVRAGELAHLIAERTWREWQQSLTEAHPEMFISTLRSCGALQVILPEIDALFGVPNPREDYCIVDAGVHCLMTLSIASALSSDPIVRCASVLLNVGKASTPIAAWPSHDGHELRSLDILPHLCQRLRIPKSYQKLAMMAARWHETIHRSTRVSAELIVQVFDQTNAYRDAHLFEQLLIVCEADFRARGGLFSAKRGAFDYQSGRFWRIMLAQCCKINAQVWVQQGLQGIDIKAAVYQARVACVQTLQKQWEQNEIK